MAENELQLNAQRALQEFDNAIETPDTDLKDLGRKAIAALDEFIAHWNDKPYMQDDGNSSANRSEGEDGELREYAERQIQWATDERQRVRDLLTPSK